MHRPAVAAHAVAAVQGAGEQHVLRADEDGFALGVDVPFASVFAAHEDDRTIGCEPFEFGFGFIAESEFAIFVREDGGDPLFHCPCGLLHERPHGQAIDEAARPGVAGGGIGLGDAVPQPREDDGSSFAEAGRDVDQL